MKESKRAIKPPPGLFFCFGSKGRRADGTRLDAKPQPQSTRPAPWTVGGWGDSFKKRQNGDKMAWSSGRDAGAGGRANQASRRWTLAGVVQLAKSDQGAITRARPDRKKGAGLAMVSRSGKEASERTSWGSCLSLETYGGAWCLGGPSARRCCLAALALVFSTVPNSRKD